MKLDNLFTDFLKDTVNLNQSRIDLLESSVTAIKAFIRQSEYEPHVKTFEEQGSWAHRTIIRPVDGNEFDADLLVMINPVAGWTAADYVNKLGDVFSGSPTYKDRSKPWDYCVTVSYAGDRKIDIAPCVVGRIQPNRLEVCNRATDTFERSEPLEYTQWLREKNAYSGSNSFRKVTRLFKYMRDIKETFTCPSVLLTTLLGARVEWFDKDTNDFADTPTTLRTIIGRLDDWLQARPTKPAVTNPQLSSEDFAAAWTTTQYSNFRNFISKYRKWVDEAFDSDERTDSIKLWRKIFGEEFAKGSEISVVKAASDGMAMARSHLLSSTAAHLEGLVDAVRDFGLSILPSSFYQPPHMQPPPWRREGAVSAQVQVSATWHGGREVAGRAVRNGDILQRNGGLWFDVRVNNFEPVPSGYRVEWRITNTGEVAISKRAGRGGFYTPQRGHQQWERLEYRGVHIVEAFIIRTRDNVLVGQSPPFSVVIE